MQLSRKAENQSFLFLLAALAAISAFRIYYIMHGPLDLSPDEAQYWEWSRRLDLSYYSKGPLIAYLIHIGTYLFGSNVLGVRIMAVFFSALSSVFIFLLADSMFAAAPSANDSVSQRSGALLSALSFQAIPLFATFGVIFTIDSPFTFFWTASLFTLYKAISCREPQKQWLLWITLGITVGLGLLAKYTMAFFPLCGLLLLLFSEKRPLLRTPLPYMACVISLLVFTPVIVWNAKHGWVTLRHTAGQAHIADGITLSPGNFFEFLGSQIGIVTPLFFCLMTYAIFKFLFSDRRFQSKFLFYFFTPVLGFFLLKALQGKVEPNWAMTAYITGIIAAVEYCLANRSKTKIALLASSILLALFVTLVSHYPSIVGLPQKLDPSARLKGWKALGMEVSMLKASAGNGYFLLFSDSYQTSSELAFYVQNQPETFAINLGRRMNQYDLWPDMNERAAILRQKGVAPINGIFVQAGNRDIPPLVAGAFDHFEKNVFRIYGDHGHLSKEYSIFICYNFKGLKIGKPETW